MAMRAQSNKRVGWVEAPPVQEPPGEAFKPPPSPPPGTGVESEDIPRPILPPPASPNAPQDEESAFTKKRRRNWAKLIAKVYFDDPCLCKSCGKEMKIIAAITSPAQDDVIEKVLRHLKVWDPPWKRERKAPALPLGITAERRSPPKETRLPRSRSTRSEVSKTTRSTHPGKTSLERGSASGSGDPPSSQRYPTQGKKPWARGARSLRVHGRC